MWEYLYIVFSKQKPDSVLCHKSELIERFGVFRAGGDQVNPCGLDRRMAQHIYQPLHIPSGLIDCPGE